MARCESTQVRRLRACRAAAWTAVLLLVAATSALAQFDRGTISGTIKDEQGGVMPGVTVTARHTQTQQTASTVTDSTGFYTFPTDSALRHEILQARRIGLTGLREHIKVEAPRKLFPFLGGRFDSLTERFRTELGKRHNTGEFQRHRAHRASPPRYAGVLGHRPDGTPNAI